MSVTITSPITTSIALSGQEFSIEADTVSTSGQFNILFSEDGGNNFDITIASSVELPYLWTPTNSHVGTSIIIRVVDASNPGDYDDSDAFNVATTDRPEEITQSTESNIRFSAWNGVTNVKLEPIGDTEGTPLVDGYTPTTIATDNNISIYEITVNDLGGLFLLSATDTNGDFIGAESRIMIEENVALIDMTYDKNAKIAATNSTIAASQTTPSAIRAVIDSSPIIVITHQTKGAY